MATMLRISLFYFAMVFAAGFMLGTVRVLLLVDAIGERNAELLEAPIMALVCAAVARALVLKHSLFLNTASALYVGLVALALLLAVEFSVVLTLRGLSIQEYIANRDPAAGIAYLLGLAWYAGAPLFFTHRNKPGPNS